MLAAFYRHLLLIVHKYLGETAECLQYSVRVMASSIPSLEPGRRLESAQRCQSFNTFYTGKIGSTAVRNRRFRAHCRAESGFRETGSEVEMRSQP